MAGSRNLWRSSGDKSSNEVSAAPWLEVDIDGLRKTIERKGKAFAIFELVQNAWDEDAEVEAAKEKTMNTTINVPPDDDRSTFGMSGKEEAAANPAITKPVASASAAPRAEAMPPQVVPSISNAAIAQIRKRIREYKDRPRTNEEFASAEALAAATADEQQRKRRYETIARINAEQAEKIETAADGPTFPTLLDAALYCISRDWFVFPCFPCSKAPATEHGVKEASNSEAQIREWWAANPNFNPAIALGPSNLVVYDFDSIQPFVDLPDTFTVRTGRLPVDGIDGIQMYFTGSCKTHSHANGGGEVRSRGAYVMAPGAIHPSGNPYVIVADRPLAVLPQQNEEDTKPAGPVLASDEQNTIAQYVEAAFEEVSTTLGVDKFDWHPREPYEGGFKWRVLCYNKDKHTMGVDFDSSTTINMLPSGKLLYCCKHSTGQCDQLMWKNFREWAERQVGHWLRFGDPVDDQGVILGVIKEPIETPSSMGPSVELVSSVPSDVGTVDWTLTDMPVSVMNGRLGEICRNRLIDNKRFPIAYAWPALLAAAGVMVPAVPPDPGIVTSVDPMTNSYTGLVGPVHSGKSQVINWANGVIGLPREMYSEVRAGSSETLLRKLMRMKKNGALMSSLLIDLDEWAHLFAKASIENSSFNTFLHTAFYKRHVNVTLGGGFEVDLSCALTFIGGIVREEFGSCFGSKSMGGLHDRFVFGLCPEGYNFLYRPFEGKPERTNPIAVKIDKEVFEMVDAIRKANKLIGREAEHAVRAAHICASFDGRPVLRAKDCESMVKAYAEEQLRIRDILKPNEGKNPEAIICNAIIDWLNRWAADGRWVRESKLRHGLQRLIKEYNRRTFNNAISSMRKGEIDREKLPDPESGVKVDCVRLRMQP